MSKRTNTSIYKPKGYNELAKAIRLPKKQGGGFIGYQESNQQVFNPTPSLGGSSQYDSLTANNKFTNEQEFGPGLSSDSIEGSLKVDRGGGSNIDLSSNMFGSAAQIVASFVGDQSENPQYGNFNSTTANVMSQVGVIGQVAGAVGDIGGKLLKPDYDEYGIAKDKGEEELYYQAGAYFDPLGAAEAQDTIGEGILAALLPGWGGENVRKKEEADALARKQTATDARNKTINTQTLNRLNTNTQNYQSIFAKYGGKLPKKQLGGTIEDPLNNKLNYFNKEVAPTTAFVTQNVKRPLSRQSTIYELSDKLKLTPQEIEGQYNTQYLDSIANVYPEYISGRDSVGQPALSKLIPNINTRVEIKNKGGQIGNNSSNTPIIQQYGGQLHSGPDQGIEVDTQGNPTSITGNEPVALTEKGEVSYNGYVFSDSIKYKK